MTDKCPHLQIPTSEAYHTLRNPLHWSCHSCHSTDGIWCCLTCGHVGCGRRAHLPALGGGHSKHHFYTRYFDDNDVKDVAEDDNGKGEIEEKGGQKRRVKLLPSFPKRRHFKSKAAKRSHEDASEDASEDAIGYGNGYDNRETREDGNDEEDGIHHGRHEICLDIVSKAVHCYVCDDYVLSDASWLQSLRQELQHIEHSHELEQAKKGARSLEEDYVMVDSPVEVVMVDFEDGLDDTVRDANVLTFLPCDRTQQPLQPTDQATMIPGTTGLSNLGNTCYMNSVLQMLSHCIGFRSFFRDYLRAAAPLRLAGKFHLTRQSTTRLNDALHNEYKPFTSNHLNASDTTTSNSLPSNSLNNDNPTTSNSLNDDSPASELALIESTHALLRVLWSGRWICVTPRYFVNAVWTHCQDMFAARKQQDANEFLNFYLNRLDEEMTPTNNKHPTAVRSVMMDLFGIDQNQEVICDMCGTITRRKEPLLGLVLSLPDADTSSQTPTDDPSSINHHDDTIDLSECFATLRTSGRFTDENQFHCDTCQCKTDATWKVLLERRPQSLLISLRRTLWSLEKGVHKDGRRVSFPMELDASDLLDLDNVSRRSESYVHLPSKKECRYTLTSVVSHSGSSPFVGHYISWCRVEEKGWFLFNDSRVTPTTQQTVLEAQAYILLYERMV